MKGKKHTHIYISHFKIPRHSIPPHTAQALRSAAKCLLFFSFSSFTHTHSLSEHCLRYSKTRTDFSPSSIALILARVRKARVRTVGRSPYPGALVRRTPLRVPFHPLSTEAPLARIASPRGGCRCTHGGYRCPWWVSGVLRCEGPLSLSLCCCC